jgi:transcriptional regulator with XRE-family HTH domain
MLSIVPIDWAGVTMSEREGKGVGARIRRFREQAGLSQSELGEKLGVSYQQIQKYERGTNRVSVDTLVRLGRILNHPLVAFLDPNDAGQARAGSVAEARPDYGPLARDERELLKAYRELPDDKLRSAYLLTLKAAARKT